MGYIIEKKEIIFWTCLTNLAGIYGLVDSSLWYKIVFTIVWNLLYIGWILLVYLDEKKYENMWFA